MSFLRLFFAYKVRHQTRKLCSDNDDDDNAYNHNFEDIEDVDIDVNIDNYNDIHFGDADDEYCLHQQSCDFPFVSTI